MISDISKEFDERESDKVSKLLTRVGSLLEQGGMWENPQPDPNRDRGPGKRGKLHREREKGEKLG